MKVLSLLHHPLIPWVVHIHWHRHFMWITYPMISGKNWPSWNWNFLKVCWHSLTQTFIPFLSRFNYSLLSPFLSILSFCSFTFCSSFIFYLIISGCYFFLSSVENEHPWKLLVASFEWNPFFYCGFWSSWGKWREKPPLRGGRKRRKEGEVTLRVRVMKFFQRKNPIANYFSLQLGSRLIVIYHLISSSYSSFTISSLSLSLSLKFKPIEFEFSSLERSLAREWIHFFVIESNVGWSMRVSFFLPIELRVRKRETIQRERENIQWERERILKYECF